METEGVTGYAINNHVMCDVTFYVNGEKQIPQQPITFHVSGTSIDTQNVMAFADDRQNTPILMDATADENGGLQFTAQTFGAETVVYGVFEKIETAAEENTDSDDATDESDLQLAEENAADENEIATYANTDGKYDRNMFLVKDWPLQSGTYDGTVNTVDSKSVNESTYKSYLSSMLDEVEGTTNGNLPITDWKRATSGIKANIELQPVDTQTNTANSSTTDTNKTWWSTVSGLSEFDSDSTKVWDGSRKKSHNFTNYLSKEQVTIYGDKLYDSATWVDGHEDGQKTPIYPEYVYRFQGTFDIGNGDPNDYSYTIRQVVSNEKLYINDNMWVFIYPKDTTLNADNYMDYLAFWSGTRNQNGKLFAFNERVGSPASQDKIKTGLTTLTDGWNMPVAEDNAGAIIQSVYNSGNHATQYVIDVFADDYAVGGGMYRMLINKQQVQKTAISFKKTSESGTALAGAEFEIIDNTTNSTKYTATSDADGMVTFKLLDGTYTMREKTAPNGYIRSTDTWTINVTNRRYTIEKNGTEISKDGSNVYVITNKSEQEEILNGLEQDKTVTVTDYNKREYRINLSAATTGSDPGKEAESASVVLVLDASGSMEEKGKSLTDIRSAADSFVQKLLGTGSKVSVIWYQGSEGSKPTITETAFTEIGDNLTDKGYLTIYNAIYSSKIKATGGTPMGTALERAYTRLTSDNSGNKKYVLLFTDGLPGHVSNNDSWNCRVANKACNAATNIKNIATLYTVGYQLEGNINWKLGHSSSSPAKYDDDNKHATNEHQSTSATNFLKDNIATQPAAGSAEKYAYTTSDKAGLEATFESLAGQIGSQYTIQPDRIVDVIDARFKLTDAQKKAFDEYNKAHENDKDADGNTVTNRIDYVENTDGTTTITWYGKAAFIGNKESTDENKQPWSATIDVVAKDDFIGGNMIPTNGDTSGIYIGSALKKFPKPSVNVKLLEPSLGSKEITVYKSHTIKSSDFPRELENLYKFTELDDKTELKSGEAGIPTLTDIELTELKAGKPVEKNYIYPGTSDNVGTFKYEYKPVTDGIKTVDANGNVLSTAAAMKNHPATTVGNAVEKYELTITFVPSTVDRRKRLLSNVTEPDTTKIKDANDNDTNMPKGGLVVNSVIKNRSYTVNVWSLEKISSSSTTDKGGNEVHPKLEGAIFKLQGTKLNDAGKRIGVTYYGKSNTAGFVEWYTTYDSDTHKVSNKVDVNTGIAPDTYKLTELVAPAGYALNNQTWTIRTEDDKTCNINGKATDEALNAAYENTPVYALPSTGGKGIFLYMIGGMLLMGVAAWILYKNKREEVLKR